MANGEGISRELIREIQTELNSQGLGISEQGIRSFLERQTRSTGGVRSGSQLPIIQEAQEQQRRSNREPQERLSQRISRERRPRGEQAVNQVENLIRSTVQRPEALGVQAIPASIINMIQDFQAGNIDQDTFVNRLISDTGKNIQNLLFQPSQEQAIVGGIDDTLTQELGIDLTQLSPIERENLRLSRATSTLGGRASGNVIELESGENVRVMPDGSIRLVN